MAFLFYFSSIKGEDIPKFDIANIDKFFHAVEYFILGALLVRAFSNSVANPNYTYILIVSILIAAMYGLSDEFHQRFVSGRTADMFDVLADAIGSSLGAALYSYKERVSKCHQ